MMLSKGANIFLGRFVKPFGIKGELKMLPSGDFWDGVLESEELFIIARSGKDALQQRALLKSHRKHGGLYVLKLEGLDDRSVAEEFVGAEMFIPSDRIDVALPDRVMPFQVAGCKVRTEDGAYVGMVTGTLFTAAHDIYEVTGKEGITLIPAVPAFIIRRDTDKGEIVIKPIPGLLNV